MSEILEQENAVVLAAAEKMISLGQTISVNVADGKQAKSQYKQALQILMLLTAYKDNTFTDDDLEAVLYGLKDLSESSLFPTVNPIVGQELVYLVDEEVGGVGVWGSIIGTITDQTDLINYLNSNYQGILGFTPVNKAGDTAVQTISFSTGQGIDNAGVFPIGASATYILLGGTELRVKDKLMTIGYAGAAGSGGGAGFEIMEGGSVTGYFKTTAARTGFALRPPALSYASNFIFSSTAERNITFQDGDGTVAFLSDAFTPTSGNGTTVNGTAIDWGGTLTGNTTIDGGAFNLTFTNITAFTSVAASIALATPGSLGYLQILDGLINLTAQNGAQSSVLSVKADASPNFTDNRTTKIGLTYDDDYSATYTTRSLVDKAYADAAVGTNWSKANGGTATGTNTFAFGTNPWIITSSVSTGTGATAGIQQVFNSLTTGNGLDVSSSSLTTGNIAEFINTSTANNNGSILRLTGSGANANSGRTSNGLIISVTNTGTSSENDALVLTASGASTNYALRFTGNITGTSTGGTTYSLTSNTHNINVAGIGGNHTQSIASGAVYQALNTSVTVFRSFNITQNALSSSWVSVLTVTPGAHTAMTAGTEFKTAVFTGSTQTWAAGAATLTNQRYNHFLGQTVNAGAGNTFTNTYNVYVDAPTNGSGTTPNLYSIGAAGISHFIGGVRLTSSSTAGYVWTASDTSGNGAWAASGSGITNSAAANEMMKSDGTDAVSSGIYSLSSGNLQLGSAAAANVNLTISTDSSTNGNLVLDPKGLIVTGSGKSINATPSIIIYLPTTTYLGIASLSGAEREIASDGSATDVSMRFTTKGAGTYNFSGTSSQAATLRLFEDTDDGTNYTSFKVGTQAGNIDYTLPTSNAAGVLTNNGSGVLSWAAGSGITNGAAANELMKSDGANAVASGVFSTSAGSIVLGSASIASAQRTITVLGSGAAESLGLFSRGTGSTISLGNSTTTFTAYIAGGSSSDMSLAVTSTDHTIRGGNEGSSFIISGIGSGTTGVSSANLRLITAAASTGNANSGNIYLDLGAKAGSGTVGNIGLFTTSGSFGSGEKVMFINNATTPSTSAPTNGIILHAKDSSDGSANSTLALYLEQAVEAIGVFVESHKIKVWINNVEYWISLDAV